jgi:hypothetical protein
MAPSGYLSVGDDFRFTSPADHRAFRLRWMRDERWGLTTRQVSCVTHLFLAVSPKHTHFRHILAERYHPLQTLVVCRGCVPTPVLYQTLNRVKLQHLLLSRRLTQPICRRALTADCVTSTKDYSHSNRTANIRLAAESDARYPTKASSFFLVFSFFGRAIRQIMINTLRRYQITRH